MPAASSQQLPAHTAAGLRAYRCATGRYCGHVNADQLEQQAGKALLYQAPNAMRRHLSANTPEQAAAAAAMLLRVSASAPTGSRTWPGIPPETHTWQTLT